MFSLMISITRNFGQLLRCWCVLAHLISVNKFIGYLESLCPPLNLAQKSQFFNLLVLMLIGSLKRLWGFVKHILPKIAIAWSAVLMLISYNCTSNLYSVDVSVSVNSNINGPSINLFDKYFNFSFYNNDRLPYEVRKY